MQQPSRQHPTVPGGTGNDAAAGRIGVLFVCLGNICRSPLAEGAFRRVLAERHLADRFVVASAGISDFHFGEPPDPRAIAVAAARGIDISAQRSRPIRPGDFLAFDWILAMDAANLTALDGAAPDHALAHVGLLLDVAEGRPEAVPDPYYDDRAAFERVLDTVSAAAEKLADRLVAEAQAAGAAPPKRRST